MGQIFWLIYSSFFAGLMFYIIRAGVYPEYTSLYTGLFIIHIISICIGAVSLWVDLCKGKN